MAITGLLTTQTLTAVPATVNANDNPSGTFQATRLTVANTAPAIEDGKIKITQGATTEEARIITVENGTQFIVEKLVATYNATATVTFMGHSNPGNALGFTLARNSSGVELYGSKNKAEVFWNNLALDMLNVATYADTSITALQNSVNTQITNFQTSVNNQITTLTNYVNTQIQETKDWVFANAVPIGFVMETYTLTPPNAFWMLLYGQTIGSAASAAQLKGDAYKNIYLHFWANVPQSVAIVTGGRGTTALADWNANKPMAVPDERGKVTVGLDNMGGTPAGRITAASVNGANAIIMGGSGGSETQVIGLTHLPPHPHEINVPLRAFATTSGTGSQMLVETSSNFAELTTKSTPGANSTPLPNTQPWSAKNKMVKI